MLFYTVYICKQYCAKSKQSSFCLLLPVAEAGFRLLVAWLAVVSVFRWSVGGSSSASRRPPWCFFETLVSLFFWGKRSPLWSWTIIKRWLNGDKTRTQLYFRALPSRQFPGSTIKWPFYVRDWLILTLTRSRTNQASEGSRHDQWKWKWGMRPDLAVSASCKWGRGLSRAFSNDFMCFLNLPGRDRSATPYATIGRCFAKLWRQRDTRVTLNFKKPEWINI